MLVSMGLLAVRQVLGDGGRDPDDLGCYGQNQRRPRLANPIATSRTVATSATRPRVMVTVRTSTMWLCSRASSTAAPLTVAAKLGGPNTRSERMLPVTSWTSA